MAPPKLSIETTGTAPAGAGHATVEWRVANVGSDPVRLVAIAAPHGKLRADDRTADLTLAPGAASVITLQVACGEPPGTEIENAFLILTAEAAGSTWQILARMRVRVDADGLPRPVVERVDVQEVGFSGQR